jgi:3'-phosphoadenosine 5'-phosphosulfate sulfotransferase (PAPS reductase)/FAD synthetase
VENMNYKYKNSDLKRMQSLSFEMKIRVAQTRILEWYLRFNGKVAVDFSGGKDSTVLLDLARRIDPNIPAVFVDTGIEFPEVKAFVRQIPNVTVIKPQYCKVCVNCGEGCFSKITKNIGWCFPSKEIAQNVKNARLGKPYAWRNFDGINKDGSHSTYKESTYARWQYLIDINLKISDECCDILKEKPLDKWHKDTGLKPIIGVMASESQRRKYAWLATGCNAFDSKKQVSKPLSIWTEQDILRYLLEFNVPYASIYGEILSDKKGHLYTTGESRTGCCLCPIGCHLEKENKFIRLKKSHPDLWEYGIKTLRLGDFLDEVKVNYGGENANTQH